MTIDFLSKEYKAILNFNGGEGTFFAKIVDDGVNKIICGMLEPGSSIGMHCHETSAEIIFVVSGNGTVKTPNGDETVSAGQCSYCKKGDSHSLCNTGDEDLHFYAVVPQFG
ncbi:MAG: cupin domain-containing protein [Clostridia bacterium]|nr:cupin domain-containing protein [Clostridia bacterium]